MRLTRNTRFLIRKNAWEHLDNVERKRVLLDTDANNEIDDQHAIAYLLLNGGYFEVEGITVNRTNNGGDIEEQAREADRIIQLCDLAGKISPIHGASGAFEQID